jgi:hypothetical protein
MRPLPPRHGMGGFSEADIPTGENFKRSTHRKITVFDSIVHFLFTMNAKTQASIHVSRAVSGAVIAAGRSA